MIRLLKIILAILAAYIVFILVVDNFVVENSKPQKADFVVVVSGGDTVGRTKKGIELYKQAYAPKLLLSGDAADSESPSNAEVGPTQKILLVTSPYHSRRAKLEFERAFKSKTIQAEVISVNAEDKNWARFWWLKPKSVLIAILETLKLPIVLVKEL